jgi:hypothetical protein
LTLGALGTEENRASGEHSTSARWAPGGRSKSSAAQEPRRQRREGPQRNAGRGPRVRFNRGAA